MLQKVIEHTHLSTSETQKENRDPVPTLFSIDLPEKLSEHFAVDHVIGEGNYGVVYLLYSTRYKERNKLFAMKKINLEKSPGPRTVYLEVYISEHLNHPNLMKTFGHIWDGNFVYMISQYAQNGELFAYIDAGKGVGPNAYKYLSQILNGVEYLHNKGYAHRDLKPENVILDAKDCIKLCDFGLTVQCIRDGKERFLQKSCGTEPYIAVEVYEHKVYSGFLADMWSIGVLWVVLVAGEMMWDRPDRRKDRSYMCWISKRPVQPWNRLSERVIRTLRKLIHPNPRKRIRIPELRNRIAPFLEAEKRAGILNSELNSRTFIAGTQTRSQRFEVVKRPAMDDGTIPYKRKLISSSQPMGFDACCLFVPQFPSSVLNEVDSQSDTMLIGSQNIKYKLRYRLTRFHARNMPFETVYDTIRKVISANSLISKKETKEEMLISSSKVQFKICLYPMCHTGNYDCLVEFRRTSGDGYRFQKIFGIIRYAFLKEIANGKVSVAPTIEDINDQAHVQDRQREAVVKQDLKFAIDAVLPIPGSVESFNRGFTPYPPRSTPGKDSPILKDKVVSIHNSKKVACNETLECCKELSNNQTIIPTSHSTTQDMLLSPSVPSPCKQTCDLYDDLIKQRYMEAFPNENHAEDMKSNVSIFEDVSVLANQVEMSKLADLKQNIYKIIQSIRYNNTTDLQIDRNFLQFWHENIQNASNEIYNLVRVAEKRIQTTTKMSA